MLKIEFTKPSETFNLGTTSFTIYLSTEQISDLLKDTDSWKFLRVTKLNCMNQIMAIPHCWDKARAVKLSYNETVDKYHKQTLSIRVKI